MEPGRVPPPPPPPPTTVLGKYKLGRLLGRGSFAKVYQAQSLVDGTTVAIKIIDKAKTVDAAMEPRIIREVSAMRRLQHHRNILKIHEVMATKTKIYLVMELAVGGELFAKISGGRKLKEPAARRYLQQLVSALSFCHQNGVAHRDLKPQNLLLDHNGILKVADFGLSALPEPLKDGLLHTACGTPAYTAPEVILRRGYHGSKADAWSCGVILYVLLAGHLPFDDSNILAMCKKIYNRDRDYLNSISSKTARSLIFSLLDPNPKTRLSFENLTQHPWFKKALAAQHQSSFFESDSFSAKCIKPEIVSGMNAFDIISLSSGLNLSGLFEATNRRQKRFTTNVSAETVIQKAKEVGEKLGFRTEKGKGWTVGLGKGRVVLIVELLEIAPTLLLGEVKVMEGGVEFEELHWEHLRAGLEDDALSWINGPV